MIPGIRWLIIGAITFPIILLALFSVSDSGNLRSIAREGFRGAFLLGAIGFTGGFLGPMIFNPDANQGPLLGILVTGPAGIILGSILGSVLGAMKKQS